MTPRPQASSLQLRPCSPAGRCMPRVFYLWPPKPPIDNLASHRNPCRGVQLIWCRQDGFRRLDTSLTALPRSQRFSARALAVSKLSNVRGRTGAWNWGIRGHLTTSLVCLYTSLWGITPFPNSHFCSKLSQIIQTHLSYRRIRPWLNDMAVYAHGRTQHANL